MSGSLLAKIPVTLPPRPQPPPIDLAKAVAKHNLHPRLAEQPLEEVLRPFRTWGREYLLATAAVRLLRFDGLFDGQGHIIIDNQTSLAEYTIAVRIVRHNGDHKGPLTSSGEGEGVVFVIHPLLYAATCTELPPLPSPTVSAADSSPSIWSAAPKGEAKIPLAGLSLPSPETFVALNAWMYTRDVADLRAFTLGERPESPPSMASTPTEHTLSLLSLVSGLSSNAIKLGIDDKEFWSILQESWTRLRDRLVGLERAAAVVTTAAST
jgi:hypothetical protein